VKITEKQCQDMEDWSRLLARMYTAMTAGGMPDETAMVVLCEIVAGTLESAKPVQFIGREMTA